MRSPASPSRGPGATALMQRLTGLDLSTVKRSILSWPPWRSMASRRISSPGCGLRCCRTRRSVKIPEEPGTGPEGRSAAGHAIPTGYTGEDGFEVLCDAREAVALWNLIIASAGGAGFVPAGLGARDTLRLEMGYLLSGNGLRWAQSTVQTGPPWVDQEGPRLHRKGGLAAGAGRSPSAPGRAGARRPGIPRHGYSC